MSSREPSRSRPNADMARGAAEAGRWLSVPVGFVVWLSVFWLTGRWVDGRWDLAPWGQVAGAVIGWAIGLVYVFYAVRVAKNQSARERDS